MRAHLQAISARLATIYPAHVVDVPSGATYPHFIVWSSWTPAAEQAVDAVQDAIDTTFGVTAVGLTWESVATLLTRARDALCPAGGPGGLAVAGRDVSVQWLGSGRDVSVDRDVTIAGTNRHPLSGVDLYRLVSVAA